MFRHIILSIAIVSVAGCATIEPPPLYISNDRGFGLSAAAFSPDGQLAAVANSNKIWIFDTQSLTRVMTDFLWKVSLWNKQYAGFHRQ